MKEDKDNFNCTSHDTPCDSNKIRTLSSNFSQRESIINILRNEVSLRKKKNGKKYRSYFQRIRIIKIRIFLFFLFRFQRSSPITDP